MPLTMLRPRLAAKPAVRGWQPDAVRGNRHQRGYGAAWQRLRQEILRRDSGLCVPCKAKGLLHLATQVDHIVPKAQGGSDDPINLQSICLACHKAKTQVESMGGAG